MSKEKAPRCLKCKTPMKASPNGVAWLYQCQCFKLTVKDTPENRQKYNYQGS